MLYLVKKNTVVNGKICKAGEIVCLRYNPQNPDFLEALENDEKPEKELDTSLKRETSKKQKAHNDTTTE